MPGEPTRTAQRRAAAREAVLDATRAFVAEHGFRDVQMSIVALRAGVSVGAIYKHFPSRADLLAEVYVVAVTHEFDLVQEAVAATKGAPEQIAAAVGTFCRRALQAGRFAHALLTEPTDPAVDEHRLAFREGYRKLYAELLTAGIERGELPDQDVDVASAALLGVMTEALVRPLTDPKLRTDPDVLVPAIVGHCLAAVGAAARRRRKPPSGR
ncbi:MAG: TetR/AcrR family transcriptional regulator [Actinobacteria bacterium]|nr:TetR/AcrR family transcriptional regulator [Actinomycetota bacterium]